MAHFYRLIALAFLVLASHAHAGFPPSGQWSWSFSSGNGTGSSLADVCEQARQWFTNISPPRACNYGTQDCTFTADTSGGGCVITRSNGTTYNVSVGQTGSAVCPPGADTLSDGTCACKYPLIALNGQCVPPDPNSWCEDSNLLWNSTLNPDRYIGKSGKLALGSKQTVCLEMNGHPNGPGYGCKVSWTPEMAYQKADGSWTTEGIAWGHSKSEVPDGKLSCVGDKEPPPGASEPPTPEAERTDPKCKGSKGTVNGVEVCIPPSAGNHEGVDWNRITGSDGTSTDVRTRVECNRDVCKVTEDRTTRDSSGNATGTSTIVTQDVPREAYCMRNPTAKVCTTERDRSGINRPGPPASGSSGSGSGGNGNGDGDKESSFGGTCGGGFQCEGDAIQCAIAKEQHKRSCELFVNSTPQSELFNREKDKEGNQTENLPGNQTFDLANRISSADALGVAASGLKDLQVSVWNHAVTLPLSGLNPYLAILGNLLVAVSFLIAARIVGRG